MLHGIALQCMNSTGFLCLWSFAVTTRAVGGYTSKDSKLS